jgi:hypothetical protein
MLGLCDLSEFPILNCLRKLYLADNLIRDGLGALSNLSLTLLDLSNNKIENFNAVKPLANSGIQRLHLLKCPVSLKPSYRGNMFALMPELRVLDDEDQDGNDAPSDESEESEQEDESDVDSQDIVGSDDDGSEEEEDAPVHYNSRPRSGNTNDEDDDSDDEEDELDDDDDEEEPVSRGGKSSGGKSLGGKAVPGGKGKSRQLNIVMDEAREIEDSDPSPVDFREVDGEGGFGMELLEGESGREGTLEYEGLVSASSANGKRKRIPSDVAIDDEF